MGHCSTGQRYDWCKCGHGQRLVCYLRSRSILSPSVLTMRSSYELLEGDIRPIKFNIDASAPWLNLQE